MTSLLYTHPSCTVDCAIPSPTSPLRLSLSRSSRDRRFHPLRRRGLTLFRSSHTTNNTFHQDSFPCLLPPSPSFHPLFVYLSRTRAIIHTSFTVSIHFFVRDKSVCSSQLLCPFPSSTSSPAAWADLSFSSLRPLHSCSLSLSFLVGVTFPLSLICVRFCQIVCPSRASSAPRVCVSCFRMPASKESFRSTLSGFPRLPGKSRARGVTTDFVT